MDTVVQIQPEDPGSDDARALVAELDELLSGLYSLEKSQLELQSGDLEQDRGRFLVARDGSGCALGCGAIRRIGPTIGELKRMYVRPPARGLGVGQAILSALETWAGSVGIERVVLETGVHQPDAMFFYAQSGYQRIDRYGGSGSEESICYGKRLS
jgi:putative acetyltransferase